VWKSIFGLEKEQLKGCSRGAKIMNSVEKESGNHLLKEGEVSNEMVM